MDELLKVLINNGPMGVVAGIMFYLLLQEKREHRETRTALNEVYGKYESLVEKAITAMSHVSTIISERIPNKN